MIRKVSSEGVGYSVVEVNNHRHVYAAAVPRTGSTLQEQAQDALRTIRAVMEEEGTHGSIVQQAVFMNDIEQTEACRRIIHDFYGAGLPATSYVAQPPCEGKLVAIEALGVGRDSDGVQIERVSEQLVVTRHEDVSWFHCADIRPQTPADAVYDRSLDAFTRMKGHLTELGVPFGNVIRTWLYLGDIVGPEGKTQRYKELNRARTDFFKGTKFGAGMTPPGLNGTVYPASTGIGTDGRTIVMSCIGLVTGRKDMLVVPLENPQQTSVFEYPEKYGVQSPQFARAMAVVARNVASIFISGTASITGSETRFVGDIVGQTNQTFDNIRELISHDNFRRHGVPGMGATLDDLALVRVYIKRREDYAKARAVCKARLGELPTIYAIGDVCRPDLLVEIEGVAFSGSC
jgi:enamine deaminase RidA (YjgF/YER057c/UK114 family)